MKLADLLMPWSHLSIPDCHITGIQNDSRHIQIGDLFLAYPGAASDGRLYCQQAIASGAVAVAYDPEHLPEKFAVSNQAIYIPISQLAKHLAEIASRFYDYPTHSLFVTGVTGTNGKTTIAWQLTQAYHALGLKAAYIGTLGQGVLHQLQPVGNTTPDALHLQRFFYDSKQQAVKHICMEVSSHALIQQRVAEIPFAQAIFTI